MPAVGHQVVLGTAGSGKTTMAILRAAFLADPEMPSHGPTLLLTYNKALCAYIRAIAAPELANVTVEHYHKFARGYLASKNKMGRNAIVKNNVRQAMIARALAEVKKKYKAHPFFDRPINFFASELEWLAKHGIVSLKDYEAQDRVGRAEARLERHLRKPMWEIRQVYLRTRVSAGYKYDFDDLASAVAAELQVDRNPRRYKHIIIDEGQDLSPEMIRSLAKAIPQDGSITFFGDVAQQIYGHRMSWRSAGLHPIRVWKFAENYRNSREIAALGLAIAEMPYYASVSDMVAPTATVAAGPKPTLVFIADQSREIKFVVDQAKDNLFPDWVVLLINPKYLWEDGTLFSPRNAAADYGRYITSGYAGFEGMYADEVVGTRNTVYRRTAQQSPASPTDQQAEVLIQDRILMEDILGVAVKNDEQGLTERARLKTNGVNPDMFRFIVAPHMFNKYDLDRVIKNGTRPPETLVTFPNDETGGR